MKKNMGRTDQIVRALIGAVMIVYGLVFQNFVGLVGLIPLVTAAFAYCPLYTILGISTDKYGE
ncbi:MAG: DUF2892 domain-containing protein [Chlorobiaceae bacterium]|nr:DUF2892 domain-containing protein [Chlorobiaceae bacterium]